MQLRCRRCGNHIMASVHQLADHFGPSRQLGGLAGHFRCPLCGSVTVDAVPARLAQPSAPLPLLRRHLH